MKRSKLHAALALATAMGGLGTGLFMQSAGAVNLSQQNIGDVLIFPYYTVRDGWSTLMHITNTSDQTVALKIRFLEGSNSRDVLDFNVVMSPHDLFAGSISANASGNPVFKVGSGDTTCAVPAVPAAGWSFMPAAYTGSQSDLGPVGYDRLREGYAVVMVMGHAEASTAIAQAALHGTNGKAQNCPSVVNAFKKSNIVNTASQFGEPINALVGNYSFLHAGRGVSAGGNAVTLANFVTVATPIPAPAKTCTPADMFFNPVTGLRNPAWNPTIGCPNLITAQEPYDFLEPSFADAYPNQAVIINDDTATSKIVHFSPTYGRGYLAVSEVLRATNIINEWTGSDVAGVTTEWVVTQPTKNFFVDKTSYAATPFNEVQSALSTQRFPVANPKAVPPVVGFDPNFAPPPAAPFSEAYSSVVPGQSCNNVGITFYDREEQAFEIQGGVVPSPAPREAVALCFETNVIKFASTNNLPIFPSAYTLDLTNDLSGAVADGTLTTPFGWLNLRLDEAASAQKPPSPLAGPGLPVVGFMIKQRNLGAGSAQTNYGYLTNHSYKGRGVVAPNVEVSIH